jgi:hypothetical protein
VLMVPKTLMPMITGGTRGIESGKVEHD